MRIIRPANYDETTVSVHEDILSGLAELEGASAHTEEECVFITKNNRKFRVILEEIIY